MANHYDASILDFKMRLSWKQLPRLGIVTTIVHMCQVKQRLHKVNGCVIDTPVLYRVLHAPLEA